MKELDKEVIYTDAHTTENGVEVSHLSLDNSGHDYVVEHGESGTLIGFQNGNTLDYGVNGVTNEALLAILIHRTKSLNEKFPCKENEDAIEHMEKALEAFENRIIERKKRNVYGKDVV